MTLYARSVIDRCVVVVMCSQGRVVIGVVLVEAYGFAEQRENEGSPWSFRFFLPGDPLFILNFSNSLGALSITKWRIFTVPILLLLNLSKIFSKFRAEYLTKPSTISVI